MTHPITDPEAAAFSTPETDSTYGEFGLSKREYFAGLAFQGMIAANPVTPKNSTAEQSVSAMALGAVGLADALIQALNAPPKSDEKRPSE